MISFISKHKLVKIRQERKTKKMDPKPVCIYHADCADGFASAYVVWKYAKDQDIEVIFEEGIHGKEPDYDLLKDALVYFVDFCYKSDVMKKVSSIAKKVIILDHHKSVYEDLIQNMALPENVQELLNYVKQTTENKIEWIHLSKNINYNYGVKGYSGVGVTWDYFYKDIEMPFLLQCIQDRDLWKWKIDKSKQILKGLDLYEYDFEVWDDLINHSDVLDFLYSAGVTIEQYEEREMEKLIHSNLNYLDTTIWGAIPLINCPASWISDVGSKLASGYPFVFLFYFTAEGVKCAFRSIDVDVGKIAELFGGGGHKNSAGFSLTHNEFFDIGTHFRNTVFHLTPSFEN